MVDHDTINLHIAVIFDQTIVPTFLLHTNGHHSQDLVADASCNFANSRSRRVCCCAGIGNRIGKREIYPNFLKIFLMR